MKEKEVMKIIAMPLVILLSPIVLIARMVMGKEKLQAKLTDTLMRLKAEQAILEGKTKSKKVHNVFNPKLPWYDSLSKRSARGYNFGREGKMSNKKYIK